MIKAVGASMITSLIMLLNQNIKKAYKSGMINKKENTNQREFQKKTGQPAKNYLVLTHSIDGKDDYIV